MKEIKRVRVLNTPVDVVEMEAALEFVDFKVRAGESGNYIVAMNPEKTFAVKRDRSLGDFLDSASLLLPDGIGIVLASRFLHGERMGRLAGADLMEAICEDSASKGHRVFVYGSSEEVNRGAVAELRRRYPGIQIVGRSHGYLARDAMDDLIAEINDSGADILMIGLGSPRQEHWMREYGPRVTARVCLGIGGSLDTIVGRVKRAPRFLQRTGLEWLYRLVREPRRARRQAVLPIFVWSVLQEKLYGTPRKPR